MGSFTSAPKVPNEDNGDEDAIFPPISTWGELKTMCEAELSQFPPSIHRNMVDVGGETGYDTIRIMQWNVLAQALAEGSDGFAKCPLEALTWENRRWRLLAEISEVQPDVLCMQEVDHYRFFQRALSSVGLEGVFCPKPDSPCIYISGNNGPDGCALFVNTQRFDILETKTRCLEVWHCQTNQVAILCKIRRRSDGAKFWVATTHLKARNGGFLPVLRKEQGRDLMDFMKTTVGNSTPLLLAGDMNADPSEPVHYVFNAAGLENAYLNQVPKFTTWTVREDGEHCKTLDYIFYRYNTFRVHRLLQLPCEEDIGPDRAPSFRCPSDHFALVADLSLPFPTDSL